MKQEKIISPTERILNEVGLERAKQFAKWGEQNHSLVEWMAILTEEVGETSKEAVDFYFKHPAPETDDFEDVQLQRLYRYRKELIQTAAVAIQMIECVDRNEIIERAF